MMIRRKIAAVLMALLLAAGAIPAVAEEALLEIDEAVPGQDEAVPGQEGLSEEIAIELPEDGTPQEALPEEVDALLFGAGETIVDVAEGEEGAAVENALAPLGNDGSVAVDAAHFPDSHFRLYISENLDADGDGALSASEIAAVDSLSIYREGIKSLVGIEYFTALEDLDCEGNQLRELDVSGNPKLTELRCDDNYLESLDVSGNPNLETLYCDDNGMQTLTLGYAPVDWLWCCGNSIGQLDIGGNPVLQQKVEEYGPIVKDAIIEYVPPTGWNDPEVQLRFDRDMEVVDGEVLLYGPGEPIRRRVDDITIGAGQEDDAPLDHEGYDWDLTPEWIRRMLADSRVSYESSDTSIVKVDNGKGSIKGVRKGAVTVTAASDRGIVAYFRVNVKVAPSKISLSKSKVTMGVGGEVDLTARLSSGSAARWLEWTSSNEDVAYYDTIHRVVYAEAPGTATITVRTYNGMKAACRVTVLPEPASMTLSPAGPLVLGVDQKFALAPMFEPKGSGSGIEFFSSDEDVAEVSTKGVILAKKKGAVTIGARTDNNLEDEIEVRVIARPKKAKLNLSKVTLGVGQKEELWAQVDGAEFTTSNRHVAKVSANGVVTARRPGTAKIKAKLYNGKTATCKVTVKNAPKSVAFARKTYVAGVGETFALKVTLPKNTATTLEFVTGDEEVVEAWEDGVYHAVDTGTALVTVYTHNGKEDSCEVTVKRAPGSVSLSKSKLTVRKGKKATLKVRLPAGTGGGYTFKSSNPKIAAVSDGGVVKGIKKGKATITVTTYNGHEARCAVTVK